MRASIRSRCATSSSKPQVSASAAEMVSASNSKRLVRPQPIKPGNKAASTTEGMPTRTSGMPNFASRTAIRISQAAATSRPAPRHQPLMRAITGTGKSRIAAQMPCTRRMKASASAGVSSAAMAPISAPPIKARSPSPVSTAARKPGRCANSRSAAIASSKSAGFSVFSLASCATVSRATPRASILISKRPLMPVSPPQTRPFAHSRRQWRRVLRAKSHLQAAQNHPVRAR